MYLWIMITKDKYELPIAVAESAMKLAEIVGVSEHTINNSIARVRQGKTKKSRYLRVEVDANDFNE